MVVVPADDFASAERALQRLQTLQLVITDFPKWKPTAPMPSIRSLRFSSRAAASDGRRETQRSAAPSSSRSEGRSRVSP